MILLFLWMKKTLKIVINECYGGFSVSDAVVKKLGLESPYDFNRTDERLIQLVEADSRAASGSCADLVVVYVPNEATDYMINEYDGYETLYYVLDGKIKTAC